MKKVQKKKEIYLDYAAATPVDSLVLKKMAPFWQKEFANGSSAHAAGKKARAAQRAAHQNVARALGVKEREIIFTSGGTEANNIALQGVLRTAFLKSLNKTPSKKPHILISSFEHSSVAEALSYYVARKEIILEIIPATKNGVIDLPAFEKLLRPETLLVSVLLVSNKTGIIQSVQKIAQILARRHQKTFLHTDASQAPRYMPVKPHTLGVHMLTLDGAKIYGPKGVGILFVKEGIPLVPLAGGGGQELGIRSGTVPTPLAVGFAEALTLCEKKRATDNAKLETLKKEIIHTLTRAYSAVHIAGTNIKTVPGIISATFPDISAEEVFTHLNAHGMYVSLGSACESEEVVLSRTKKTKDAVRISLGRETTKTDVQNVCNAICSLLLRRAIMSHK